MTRRGTISLQAAAIRAAALSAAICLLGTHPAFAQTLGQAQDVDISYWRVGAALVLCCALAIAGAFILRGRATQFLPLLAQRKRRLQLVETLRLTQHAALSIVDCDGRELLVLSSEHTAHVVDRPPARQPGAP